MALVTENEANAWLGQQTGKHLDYDQQYGQQCFDFFNYYYQFVTGEGPYADGYGVAGAKDIWDVPTDFFDKIPDSRTLEPNVGDVLIYGSSWGAGFGHVEVCRWSDANGCHVIGENEHGDASEGVVEVYRTWGNMRGLIGVMRPRFSPEQAPVPVVVNDPLPPTPVVTPEEPNEPTPDPVPVSTPVSVPDPAPVESDPTPVSEPTPEPEPTQEDPGNNPLPAPKPSAWKIFLQWLAPFLLKFLSNQDKK
jgi:cell division septation protein DedD